MNDIGVGESGKIRAELPTRRSSAEANPYDEILQHLQPVAPAGVAFSRNGDCETAARNQRNYAARLSYRW